MRIEYKRMLISMIAIALFLSSGGVNVSAINIPVATTYYTAEKPLTPSGFSWYRYKITSNKTSSSSSNSKKVAEGKLTNTSSKAATGTLSKTKTKSRTYSCSASIPKEALKGVVSATIGGSLSYSKSTTVSISGKIPAHKSVTVYGRTVTVKTKYSHKKQKQTKGVGKGWANSGKASSYTGTVTTKYPELIFWLLFFGLEYVIF